MSSLMAPAALLVGLCACGSSTPDTSGEETGDGGSQGTGGGAAGSTATGGKGGTTGKDGGTGGGAVGTGGGAGSIGAGGGGVVAGGVRWLGRVDASNASAVKFAWSGTGFIATVNGTKVSAKLTSEGSDAFYQPVIDGTAGTRFKIMSGVTQTAVLGDNLAAGDHVVELYRETEGMYGDSAFGGIVDGTVKTPPAGSGRLIEFIGDSISCGYGNLGVEVHPPWDNACGFTLDTEAAYQAYDMVIGRALDAEVSIIARSGWGVYRGGSGDTSETLDSVYDNTLGTDSSVTWDFARKADAVLMDLGTNDSAKGDPGTPYQDATVAMVKTIRGKYPNAWIFLTMGPMTSDPMLTTLQTYIANAVTTLADAKVTAIKMPVQDATSTGCDYHPNVAEDKKMSDLLAPAMKAKLGW